MLILDISPFFTHLETGRQPRCFQSLKVCPSAMERVQIEGMHVLYLLILQKPHKSIEKSISSNNFPPIPTSLSLSLSLFFKVKHMLGSSAEAQSNIEANTHVSNLCDLLERIWGHGLKKREVY